MRVIAVLLGIVAWLAVLVAPTTVRADEAPMAVLYTVGTGSYAFAYFGHSAVCLRTAPGEDGTCFDYGVPTTEDAGEMVWGSLRGRALFVPVRVAESRMVGFFREQDRTIERQVLPISTEEARRLGELLDGAVASGEAYAYHPWATNCTTKVRDVLDTATAGRLRRDGDRPGDGMTLRQMSEAGFSGRPLPLVGLALTVGTPGEHRMTAWERMLLPVGLRDGVRERLGVEAETVYAKQAREMPTSTGVGRAALVLLGAILALVAWRGTRREGRRAGLVIVGLVLGAVALLLEAVVVVVWYRELLHNWTLAVLWPTDVALGFMSRAMLVRYVQARLAVVASLFALSLVGVIGQPLWAPALLVLLPVGVAYAMAARKGKSALPSVAADRVAQPES